MQEGRYFGLTPSQLNLAFVGVIAALAVGGVFAAGGPNRVTDETKQALGIASRPTFTGVAPESTPAPQVVEPPCSRLAVGCEALVTNTGTWLNLRDAPSVTGGVLGRVEDAATVSIIGGPTQADGHVWWQVRSSGGEGWVADGDATTKWLVATPVAPVPEPVEAAPAPVSLNFLCPAPSLSIEWVEKPSGTAGGTEFPAGTFVYERVTDATWAPALSEDGLRFCKVTSLGWYGYMHTSTMPCTGERGTVDGYGRPLRDCRALYESSNAGQLTGNYTLCYEYQYYADEQPDRCIPRN